MSVDVEPGPVAIPDDLPESRRNVLETAIRIANAGRHPTCGAVARELGVSDQAIYFHVRKLRDSGLWPWELSKGGRVPREDGGDPPPPVVRPKREIVEQRRVAKRPSVSSPSLSRRFEVAAQVAKFVEPLGREDAASVLDLVRDAIERGGEG